MLEGHIQLIIALVVFVVTIVTAVLYMRSDARSNRQEIMAAVDGLAKEVASLGQRVTALEVAFDAFKEQTDARFNAQDAHTDARFNAQDAQADARFNDLETRLGARIDALKAQSDARFNALEDQTDARFNALEARLGARIDALAQQMQHNHRELLVRLALHHHGDGRYPVAPSADLDAEPAGSD